MKKEYLKPEIQVYEIGTPKLLDTSDNLELDGEPADGNDDII